MKQFCKLSVAAVMIVGVSRSGCVNKNSTSQQDVSTQQGGHKSVPSQVIFRDDKGRELTSEDLAGMTGRVNWSIVGGDKVSPQAQELHNAARQAGQSGNYDNALALLAQAHKEAPGWPYPVYDAAWTYLLKGDTGKAEEQYAFVDKMAPRGFFTTKTALDCLRRESVGDLKPGMYKAYVMLESLPDPSQKKAILQAMLRQSPKFPAAWQELSTTLEDDKSKIEAIETGLSHDPDGDTKGLLLINKALILERQEKRDEAISILGKLALDPQSTLATEQLSKATVAHLLQSQRKGK